MIRRPKCDHCPRAAEEAACVGQSNSRACDRVLAEPGHVPAVLNPPSLVGQAVGFVEAVVEHIANGRPEASPEVAAARLAICRACELLDPERQSCNLCGCNMPLKVTWADMACPDSPPRWNAVSS